MRRCVVAGQQGIFFTKEEYASLCSKILANNELIKQLQKEVGLNEEIIPTNH